MELADTSAWTNRHRAAAFAQAFAHGLVDGRIATCRPVRFELLFVSRDSAELAVRRAELDTLPQIGITERDWHRAEELLDALGRRGPLHHRQVPMTDLLVAAAAESAGVPVLHYDRHFELIASITGQPVHAIAPLGSL